MKNYVDVNIFGVEEPFISALEDKDLDRRGGIEECKIGDFVDRKKVNFEGAGGINLIDPPLETFSLKAVCVGETGETGETGADALLERQDADTNGGLAAASVAVSNAEFLAVVYGAIPQGAQSVICSKSGDPTTGVWIAKAASNVDQLCREGDNNYFNSSSFHADPSGEVHARKANFAACHAFMLDDIGTKIDASVFGSFEFSWVIETSPGNHQAGIILDPPVDDSSEASRFLDSLILARMCDPGSNGPSSRWARLPVGINGKSKYQSKTGNPFQCKLVEWNPSRKYSLAEIASTLRLDIQPSPKLSQTPQSESETSAVLLQHGNDVYTPKALEHPVVTALKQQGLYKRRFDAGKHDITCPWVAEHSDALDSGTAYFEPSDAHADGGFCCQHSHRDKYHLGELLARLQLSKEEARNKPVIRVIPGQIALIVDAAQSALAEQGRHYQSGGLIVSIEKDPLTGSPVIVPTNLQVLTSELSMAASWQQYSGRAHKMVAVDPPPRHVSMLYEAQAYKHLPPLVGLAHQPYFRESDGALVSEPGYDIASSRFGAFDPMEFPLAPPTHEAATRALESLDALLVGFSFANPSDRSAALAGIFTAVVRPSLPLAPGFHVHASVFGSGKTYLCELIGAFAGPGKNTKITYPASAEEATKVILAALLTAPSVVEFDDMDTDWTPHSMIKQIFTGEWVGGRILGVSKMARASTRTLFLGSGNNVGPVRDMRRRVLTINLDTGCETPATLQFASDPLEMVRKKRGAYVAAVLTVIQAWRAAGSPKSVPSFASFGGEWSDCARHPLVWLGLPDPATNLFDQIKHDPDAEALGFLMSEWQKVFGSNFTTVRKVVDAAKNHTDLHDAISEFPVAQGGDINPGKFGWLLRKNANRIVNGLSFKLGEADGRRAWAVVSVFTPTEDKSADPLDQPEAVQSSSAIDFDLF